MKLVSYAGQELATTDGIASALVTLAAAVARDGGSAVVQIPIVVDGQKEAADLIVGVGNDVLVGPCHTDEPDPDFSEEEARLTSHRLYPTIAAEPETDHDEDFGPDAGYNPSYRI